MKLHSASRWPLLALGTLLFLITVGVGQTQAPPSAPPPAPPPKAPSDIVAPACLEDVADAMATEVERYRTVLFGMKKASAEDIGAVRRDRSDDSVWMKVSDGSWKSPSEGHDGESRGDTQVDAVSIWNGERRGLFETRGVLTSELVPALTQSIRALQCQLKFLCAVADRSQDEDAPKTITNFEGGKTQVPGCIGALAHPPFPTCKLKQEPGKKAPTIVDVLTIAAECETMRQAIVTREIELLKLAVSYDAAYRSLLQFAGTFDLFLTDFRFSLVTPLVQAINLVRDFQRLPCFLSQCDEPPPLSSSSSSSSP